MKRMMDIAFSALGLVLLLPILVGVALGVALTLGRPLLFSQIRPGLKGVPFQLIKFRSMRTTTNENGALLPDADRLTGFGRFLRSSSLDELPELWNVLKGEMSLVGPRPLLMEYLRRYTSEQARRHDVRPGITGWAQINGRNSLSWDEKFALDVWYVDHQSTWLDLKIILLTILNVMTRKGINADGHATMPPFVGRESADV